MNLLSRKSAAEPGPAVPATDTIPEAPGATRDSPVNLQLSVLAIIALIAALYLARAFFVPLLIGILASYALRPVVEWLRSFHLPRPVGAALVLLTLAGSLSWIGYSLGDDTRAMIELLPEAAHRL